MFEDAVKNAPCLLRDGYIIVDFKNINFLHAIQAEIASVFLMDPTRIHEKEIGDTEYLQLVKRAKDLIVEKQLVKNLLIDNIHFFAQYFSPDIDYQNNIHLRISRPNHENDLVNWHRDTFNGNTFWEINLWFPVFPLESGAGLLIVDGSHAIPANNVHYVEEKNVFRKQVTKGSVSNELGYIYAPKVDDTILNLSDSQIKLLTPNIGQAIIFFGHAVHKAQNYSKKTRISIDVRIKDMLAPTNTKSGYYQPLTRGVISRYAEKMQLLQNNLSKKI